MSLEQVRACTWDGKQSFVMLGMYGVDSTGRWVITKEGRYQIPDDAIVLRSPAPAPEPAAVEPAPVAVEPEPAKTEPIVVCNEPVKIKPAPTKKKR